MSSNILDKISGLHHIRHIVSDLDFTLYPDDTPIIGPLYERQSYMIAKRLGIPQSEAYKLAQLLYEQYQSVPIGLKEHCGLSNKAVRSVTEYAFGVEHEKILLPCDVTRKALQCLRTSTQLKLHIFTNGTYKHARRTLNVLNIRPFFDSITAQNHFPQFFCKPYPIAYEVIEKRLGIRSPKNILFLDDSLANIRTALARGWKAILVINSQKANPANVLRWDPSKTYLITENLPALLRKIAQLHKSAFAILALVAARSMVNSPRA